MTDSRANLVQPPPAPEPHGLEELRTYGEGFAGRETELAALDQAWSEGTRVFVLHAEGGAGKTRVVAKWLTQRRDAGWRGAGRVFVHSFYSQGSDERRNASSEIFFEQALSHFGHPGPRLTDPTEQGRTLARLVVEQHGLLVLDGLEPLQHPPYFDEGRLKDLAIHSLLRTLAAGWVGESSGGGLCVVTSRQPVVELRDKIGRMVVQQPLDRLDAVAGASLLCQLEVRERAAYASPIAEESGDLISIALDHLTLARVALYKTHLISSIPHAGLDHITAAVDGLRAAGDLSYLPCGLLTRAWLRCLSGDGAGCRADLDEAWEIAERGPMPLFQADIQLTRARLFRDRAALEEARRLIEQHGYHRRDGELADALEAARGWDLTPRPPLPSPPLPPGEGAPPPKALNVDSKRDQVFISYSHDDEKFMKELLKHLKPFSRSGSVTHWTDQQIPTGAKWFSEINAALGKTNVAVFLVSPDFLASDFIHDHELGPLLKRAEAGGVKIVWVPLRPSAYKETPLNDYQAAFPTDRPLAQMSKADRDEAWVRICEEIKNAVNP